MAAKRANLPQPTPGAKIMYLIRRRPGVSREELIMHWFANHMPGVVRSQQQNAAAHRPHAWRYLATLFDAGIGSGAADAWDGVAQLWWDRPLPRPRAPFGVAPRDSFQERAEPYLPWSTVEYVIIDGSEHLPVKPLTFDEPFPTTRSGFCKITSLVAAREGVDFEAFYHHWLTAHVTEVAHALGSAGGFRYVASLSLEPDVEPYAGMAELYFHEPDGWSRLREALEYPGMERWVDAERSRIFRGTTEMIGIP